MRLPTQYRFSWHALVLALLCTGATAAGAAPAIGDDTQSELVLWHSYRAGEEKALELTVEQFRQQHPDVVLRVLAVPAGAYSQKLRNAIPYGNGPHLFVMAHDELGDLRARKLIEPLPAALEGLRVKFLAPTLSPLTQDDQLWALPMAFKSLVLFHRTDLVPTPPKTTDDMLRIADGLKGKDDDTFGLAYQLGEPFFHAPWLFGFGGKLLNDEGTKVLIDSPESVAAGAFLRSLARDGVTPVDVNGAMVTELFNTGRAGMVINGPWFISEIAPDVPYAVAPLPMVSPTGKQARPFLTVEAVFLAKAHHHPLAHSLAQHLTSDSAALVRATQAGQPVANSAVYEIPEVASNALLATFKAQLSSSSPMPTAPLTHMVWEPMAGALRQITRGALSPQAALTSARTRIEMLSRGLPPATSPTPYLVVLALVMLALLAWVVRWFRRGGWGTLVAARGAYAMVAPAALGMLLMVGIPLAMGVGVGFFAFGADETRFVGIENFKNILASADYGITHPMSFYFTLGVTIVWTLANVVLHVTIGIALALLLNQTWLRGRGLFRVLFILPWAIPNYITALVFKGLFNKQLGAINALITQLGGTPVGWFDGFLPAFTANLTTNVWLGFPFMMVTVMGALQSIPNDLYDAARVDGAGPGRRLFKITLPLLGPALVPAVVLGSIWTFNMFNIVYLVSEGQPEGASDILVTEAYRWAFARNGRFGYAAAYSLIIFFILLLYSRWTEKITSRIGT